MAALRMEYARHLDGALIGFRTGIHEENLVREARVDETLGEPLSVRDAHQIGDVPDLLRLLDEGGHENGMGMAERVHGDAAAEVEIRIPVACVEPSSLASLEGEIRPREGRQKR
jgi:hypothetical protein